MVEYFGKANRPVGQAAKTSASHAENMGSIPVPVTSTEKQDKSPAFSFSVLVAGTLSSPLARAVSLFWIALILTVRGTSGTRELGSKHCSAASVSEASQGGANSRTCLPLGV